MACQIQFWRRVVFVFAISLVVLSAATTIGLSADISVRLNSSKLGAEINHELFGASMYWHYFPAFCEAQDPQTGRFHPEFIDTLRDMAPSSLHWSSHWGNWRLGIGTFALRPDQIQGYQMTVGPLEFMDLIDWTAANPQVHLFSQYKAHEAADLMEYFNGDQSSIYGQLRAYDGRLLPVAVRRWEMGKEPRNTYGVELDEAGAVTYLKEVVEPFYQALKSKDAQLGYNPSTLKLIVPGRNGFNKFDQKIFDDEGNHYDGFGLTTFSPAFSDVNFPGFYNIVIAGPEAWKDHFDKMRQVIAQHGSKIRNLPLYIGEWATLFLNAVDKKIGFVDRATLGAFYTTDFLRMLLGEQDLVKAAYKWNLVGFHGLIYGPRDDYRLSGSYLALKLMNRYFHGNLMDITVSGAPTFSTIGHPLSQVPTFDHLPYITATAGADLDQFLVNLILINRHQDQSFPVNVDLDLDRYGIRPENIIQRRIAGDLLLNNTADFGYPNLGNLLKIETTSLNETNNRFTINLPAHSVTHLEVQVTGTNHLPFGFVDPVVVKPLQPIQIRGWVFDPEEGFEGSDPVDVEIWINDIHLATIPADQLRRAIDSDVREREGAQSRHGFALDLDGLQPGRHRFRAIAIDAPSGNPIRLPGPDEFFIPEINQ